MIMWDPIQESYQNDSALTSDHVGANPTVISEWLLDSSLPLGRNLDLENTKLLPEVFKLHPRQWLSQHISYLFVHRNILELHFSSLHHILDIVELYLDVLDLSWNKWFSDSFT